jgi:hypothetical protein
MQCSLPDNYICSETELEDDDSNFVNAVTGHEEAEELEAELAATW